LLRLFSRCRLAAPAFLLGLDLGRQRVAEIFRFEDLPNSIASSFDLTCHTQKPATSSFVSGNGPSVTMRLSPANLTRKPFELGCNPSPASITPALMSCSLYLPISVKSSSEGMTPASDSFVALTITMNLICVSSFRRRAAEAPRG
jgi:hypothetical protein